MRNISDESCRENQNTHFVGSFIRSSCLWDNVYKHCTARQAPDDDMTQAHCTLHSWGYKYTLWTQYLLPPHGNNGYTKTPPPPSAQQCPTCPPTAVAVLPTDAVVFRYPINAVTSCSFFWFPRIDSPTHSCVLHGALDTVVLTALDTTNIDAHF
jgi:hypothetical protein